MILTASFTPNQRLLGNYPGFSQKQAVKESFLTSWNFCIQILQFTGEHLWSHLQTKS